jgi:hypothetical protein
MPSTSPHKGAGATMPGDHNQESTPGLLSSDLQSAKSADLQDSPMETPGSSASDKVELPAAVTQEIHSKLEAKLKKKSPKPSINFYFR